MSRSRDSSPPCTTSSAQARITYTIPELMAFKDLPHCQPMPDVQMDPRSVLRITDGPKGKRSARTRNTQPALLLVPHIPPLSLNFVLIFLLCFLVPRKSESLLQQKNLHPRKMMMKKFSSFLQG